jgi:hypothetical protein
VMNLKLCRIAESGRGLPDISLAPKLLAHRKVGGESQGQGQNKPHSEKLRGGIRKLGRVFRDCQREILECGNKKYNYEVNIQ